MSVNDGETVSCGMLPRFSENVIVPSSLVSMMKSGVICCMFLPSVSPIDAPGFGFKVKSCKPFYASAIHFDTEELDDGDDKDQRHSFNLKKSKFTNLFLDAEHSGVAGENSWGAWPLEKYRLHYGDKNFTFVLIPLDK